MNKRLFIEQDSFLGTRLCFQWLQGEKMHSVISQTLNLNSAPSVAASLKNMAKLIEDKTIRTWREEIEEAYVKVPSSQAGQTPSCIPPELSDNKDV